MFPDSSVLGLFVVSVALVATSYKWTGLNPHRIEAGPTWLGALWSGVQVSLLLLVAFALIGGPHTKLASFLFYYACGSVVAPAFWTTFAPSPEEEPNFIMRWWKGKLNGMGDGMFKAMVTAPLALLIGLIAGIDGAFWAPILLATVLSIGKMLGTMLLVEADADDALVRKRRRMLLLGNVIATAVIGTAAMLVWATLAHKSAVQFPKIEFRDYVLILGLLAGMLFHTL